MTGERAENSMEITACMKARSLLLGLKSVDIHREVRDIYRKGQMSHRSVCRYVANLRPANRIKQMLPIQAVLQQIPQNVT